MERLRGWRVRWFLTQQALADQVGVPLSTIGRWEADTRAPRVRSLGRLCQALDVQVDELLLPGELVAVGTRRREIRGAGAQHPEPPELTAAAPALVCAYDGELLDAAGDCWHIIPAAADPQASPVVAHLQCLRQATPRPAIAACCLRGGACGQHSHPRLERGGPDRGARRGQRLIEPSRASYSSAAGFWLVAVILLRREPVAVA